MQRSIGYLAVFEMSKTMNNVITQNWWALDVVINYLIYFTRPVIHTEPTKYLTERD